MVRLAVVALLLVGGCSGPASAPGEDVTVEAESPGVATSEEIGTLRGRPLAIPTVEEGSECPVTTSTRRPDRDLGPILGNGPAGPVGLVPGGVLRFVGPDEHAEWRGSAWGGQKVLWAVDPRLRAPVLVRGRQLDGPHQVWFNDPASPELLLDPVGAERQGPGWRDYPAHTRLQAPGCYAYQVDYAGGTLVIVFRAKGPVVG